MSRIAVISDTHNCLREPVIKLLQNCDAILHAGDFCNADLFHQLQAFAPFYAVRGNSDKNWDANLPETLSVDLFGLKIFMVHNRKTIRKTEDLSDKDLIIYGHTHKYEETISNGQTWLNPGSCGTKRFRLPVTMAVIHTEKEHAYQIERIDFADDKQPATVHRPENMRTVVRNVMKDVDKGKTVTAIAKKNHITEELSDLICRLYLTHPGVDADGILKKMGL